MMEKVPASDVSKKVEYLLNTGNLVSETGLDLNQVYFHVFLLYKTLCTTTYCSRYLKPFASFFFVVVQACVYLLLDTGWWLYVGCREA